MSGLVPATILTGFLGSGKTTLFNHILTAAHGKKIAIIQNEFGVVSIDDKLMAGNTKHQTDEDIVEVLNGCVCCSVRTDLINVLKKLAARQRAGTLKLDGIIIETTGMADPAPVAQTFLVDDMVRGFTKLDGVVTLVDAKHIEQHLDEEKPDGAINESVSQVAFADRLLLNKVDLMPEEEDLLRIEARLRGINMLAPIMRCSRESPVSVDQVLGIGAFDLQRTLDRDPTFLDKSRPMTKHDQGVSSHSIDQGAPRHLRGGKQGALAYDLVKKWLTTLLEDQGGDLYRMKGVLYIAHARQKFVFHCVHMVMEGGFQDAWPEGEERYSRLVFIGKNLDPKALNEGFNSCLDTEETRAEKISRLRFQIGEKVECAMDGWEAGEVVALLYRDDSMAPGMVAPYQIKLDSDGGLIWAPADDDQCIRSRRPPGGGFFSSLMRGGAAAAAGGADDADDLNLPPAPPPSFHAAGQHQHGHVEHSHAHSHGHMDGRDEDEPVDVSGGGGSSSSGGGLIGNLSARLGNLLTRDGGGAGHLADEEPPPPPPVKQFELPGGNENAKFSF